MAIRFTILVEELEDNWQVTWNSVNGHFTDRTIALGKNPYSALTNLINELKDREERQEIINAIDAGDIE